MYDGEHAMSFQEASALLMQNDLQQTEYLVSLLVTCVERHNVVDNIDTALTRVIDVRIL